MEFTRRHKFMSSTNIKSLTWKRTENAEFTRTKRRREITAPGGMPDEGVKADDDKPRTETVEMSIKQIEV